MATIIKSRRTSTSKDESGRLVGAMIVAFVVHVLIIIGLGFGLPEASQPQPVFSLNVALVQEKGGQPSTQGGIPIPPLPALRPVEPVALETEQLQITSTQAPNLVQPQPQPETQAAVIEPAAVTALLEAPSRQIQQPPQQLAVSREREKYLDPNSQATLEGFYAEKWRRKVEQIGRVNYPEQARKYFLTGRLTLDVAIRSDGMIHSIKLLQSSGHALLDNAARRIVLLSAPFEPFPDALRRRMDILHIIRSWEFDQGNRLRTHVR